MRRRPNPSFAAARRARRTEKATAYNLFWHYTEPARQIERAAAKVQTKLDKSRAAA